MVVIVAVTRLLSLLSDVREWLWGMCVLNVYMCVCCLLSERLYDLMGCHLSVGVFGELRVGVEMGVAWR